MKYKLKLVRLFTLILGLTGVWWAFVSLVATTSATVEVAEPSSPFDPTTLYVRNTISVPHANRMALAPDRNLLYVLQWNEGGSQTGATAIDTNTYVTTSLSGLHIGFPQDVFFSYNGALAYIGLSRRNSATTLPSSSNRIEIVDTMTHAVTGSILVDSTNPYGPTRMVLAPSSNLAYVTRRGPSKVDVINLISNSVVTTIDSGLGNYAIGVTPTGDRLYTVNREGNSVTVINTATNTVITTIPLSTPTSVALMAIAITSDGNRAFITGTSSGTIVVLDTNPASPTYHQQIDTIPTTGNSLGEIALTLDDRHAFITSRTTDELLVVDIDPISPTYGTQVGQVTVGDNPFSVVIEYQIPGVIAYVSNHGSGTVSVIGYQDAISGLAAANDSPTVIGSSTHLTATISAGTEVTYTWAFGDGSYGNGETPAHIYPALGSYTAVVTATNQVSQMTATTTVHVVDPPVVGLTATNSSPTIIGNQTFLAAATSGGTNIQYSWAFGDGTYGNGTNPTHTYPAVGNYTAIVTATNTNNSLTASTQVQIVDVAVTGLAAANDSPTVIGNPTHLSATVSSGTNIQYTWAFGDGTTGVGANPTHTYPAVGNYTAIVTATNSTNSVTASTQVQVIDVAVSGLTAANDSPTILGNPTQLLATVNGGTNIQYTWAFGDGTYGSGASPIHVYPAVGSYTAVVTATNSNNTQTASTLVTIESNIRFIYLPLFNACQATPIYADVVLVLDTSGSMADPTEPGGVTKLAAAQNAAATFFTLLNFSGDQAALVSFDDSATLDHPLSQNQSSLLAALNALQLGTQTRMDLGLQTARLELTGPRHDPDNHTFIIFLTDGHPNGTTEAQVLAQATLAKQSGITIYTIGLGSTINITLLQAVATSPNHYYASPSTGDLNAIYQQIASSFACR